MRSFDVMHRVILSGDAASLFGRICGLTPDSETTRQAKEAFFGRHPEWAAKARHLMERGAVPHDLTPKPHRIGNRARQPEIAEA